MMASALLRISCLNKDAHDDINFYLLPVGDRQLHEIQSVLQEIDVFGILYGLPLIRIGDLAFMLWRGCFCSIVPFLGYLRRFLLLKERWVIWLMFLNQVKAEIHWSLFKYYIKQFYSGLKRILIIRTSFFLVFLEKISDKEQKNTNFN